MKNSDSQNPQNSSGSAFSKAVALLPWERLKGKRISYLTLPLLFMATVTEFVILSTGWKYQQVVCLPQGMGVTFFGIGPIGATILAVELLKLPLAIWTASRRGWQKGIMMVFGLPLICLLTFQLVKDMAVYEMGVALTPASQMLDAATKEDVKISQLNGELAAIEQKKADRDRKLAELSANLAKSKAEIEDSLKRNDDVRQDAISLTDYQKKELSGVEERESGIIAQFNADTAELNKSLTELRASRELEMGRATKWNAEEARIDNIYKSKMAEYANKKAAYQKAKDEYDNANFLKRQLMTEPVDPGVAPVREVDTILKPVELDAIDAQIKAKEAELTAVNNKRRDRVAQVEAEAQQMRAEYDQRSTSKREQSDHKREELLAAESALTTQWEADTKAINQEYESAAAKIDSIHAQLDDASKKAESYYELRETDIKNTQVHRIATTVEIVRGLIKGQRPISIKATAKERGDLYTDQISMVRIWVYPILAFIVAFLPTLMVEIGFSTIFEPEQQRKPHRLGFFGRGLHFLYIRAGQQKILRAERLAREATSQIGARDKALAAANALADKVLVEKETELQEAHQAMEAAASKHEAELHKIEEAHEAEVESQKEEWVAQLAAMAETLNRTVIEKDAMRDLQKSEIERQIAMRQNAWSDRLSQMRQELDEQRTAYEAERTAVMTAHHKKLMEVTEDAKSQVVQARRQAADAELAAVEATAKLSHDLKEAFHARDMAEAELREQADSAQAKITQAREEVSREAEKTIRAEKHRFERAQLEAGKALRAQEENFSHHIKQREQELTLEFEARIAEAQSKADEIARRREADIERQFEARALEVDARWKQEVAQREEAAQIRLKQREQQLIAQGDARLTEAQTQAVQEMRRFQTESERELETQAREADLHLKHELQQKDLAFQAKLKQREQELAIKTEARETELRAQWAADLRTREEEMDRHVESRVRASETRFTLETQQKEEAAAARAKQREQDLVTQLTAQSEARFSSAHAQWEADSEKKLRSIVEPLKAALARVEKERDEAQESHTENVRQVQHLEKKLTEASTFLNGWRNGKGVGAG